MAWGIEIKPNRRWPKGGWQGVYRDDTGKQRSAGIYPSKRKALQEAQAKEVDVRRGDWIDPDGPRTLFRDWVRIWQADRRKVRENTAEATTARLKHHLLPEFGDRPIGRIRRARVQDWVDEIARQGAPRESIKSYLALLSTILNAAVNEELILRNPCRGVTIPETANPGRAQVALEAAQAGALLAALPARERIVVLWSLGTGWRWGETAGLQDVQLDLATGRAILPDQLLEVSGRRRRGPTKTPAGERTTWLPPTLLEALTAHLAARDAERHARQQRRAARAHKTPDKPPGPQPDETAAGYVFTSARGALLSRNNWRADVWVPAIRDSGLYPDEADWIDPHNGKPRIPVTFHDLRSTFATVVENAGIPRPTVELLMGHRGGGTVTDRYVLVNEETRRRAVEAVEAFLVKALEAEEQARPEVAARREERLRAKREATRKPRKR